MMFESKSFDSSTSNEWNNEQQTDRTMNIFMHLHISVCNRLVEGVNILPALLLTIKCRLGAMYGCERVQGY